MASPFRYFRKHTKVFLAVAAVLAIFIFVVGDAISRGGGSGGNGADATQTVATWNGGKINAGQLGSLVAQRMLTDKFLRQVFVQGGGRSEYDFPTSVPMLLMNQQQVDRIETEVVGTEVIADLAEQAGMSVSDALVNHYIEEIGLNQVTNEEVLGILDNIGQGNARANEAIVFNTLRKLLLAYFYRRAYDDASLVVLPEQRWDDWRKVNERISVEAAVLPVERFIDDVPKPTEAQLRTFYNEYKDADPNRFFTVGGRDLPSPEPGFAEPRRIRLQYLMAGVAPRAEQMLDKVTDDEIKQYYEDNKLEFTRLGLPGDEPLSGSEETPPAGEAEQPAKGADAQSEDNPPSNGTEGSVPAETNSTTPVETPATETPAAEVAPSTSPANSAPAADDAAPPSNTPAETTPPSAEGADENPSDDKSSGVAPRNPFQLVAFQQPAATEAATESNATASPASATTASPAEVDLAAGEGEAEAETPAASDTAADGVTTETASESEPAQSPTEQIAYEPLEKVREDIRKKLATEKAEAEIERIMGEAAAQLQAEYNAYGSQLAAAQETEGKTKAPEPPAKLTDLKWLADEYNLAYEKTAPLTIRELFETAVGKAGDAASSTVSVTQAAYQSLELYEPMLAHELDGDWYLVMKIEDTPHKVPEFAEVKEQVTQAWKRVEAAKLAEKRAKELADEVEKSAAPFDQFFFADRGFEVIKPTAFFSWRNYPVGQVGTGTPPGLSDVPELKNIGPDFMEAAFSLKDKDAVGLLNFDKSAAYVIRLARRQYPEDELRQLFIDEERAWPGRGDMMMEHYSQFSQAVNEDILKERAGLEFNEEWEAQQTERMQQRQN